MQKLLIASFLALTALSACLRVDTNPIPIFEDVEEDVCCRTGQAIYWDSCFDEAGLRASIEETLQSQLTLDLAVFIALLNNRELQATYEELGIAKADLAQAGLLRNPILEVQYRFSTRAGITDLVDIGLLQNFLETALIPLKKKAALREIEAAKSMVTAKVLDVIGHTQMAFFRLQTLEAIWPLKNDVLYAAECIYDAAQHMYDAGNITKLELKEKQALYEAMKIEIANLEIEILSAREHLNVLMGLWGNQIDWDISLCLPEVIEEEWCDVENRAIANSVDLQIACSQIYATAAAMGVETSRIVFPTFDLGASAEREDSIWYVGPAFALAIPFFDFGQAATAAAQAEILRQWNLFTAEAIEIRSAARSARFRTLNAARQEQYFKNILIPLAQEILEQVILQHNAMQLGVFDLLEAKQNELERKIESIEVQKEYWIARLELEFLLKGHRIQNQI